MSMAVQALDRYLMVIGLPSAYTRRGASGEEAGRAAVYSCNALTGQMMGSFIMGSKMVLASADFWRVLDHLTLSCRPCGVILTSLLVNWRVGSNAAVVVRAMEL